MFFYKKEKPSSDDNIILKVFGCISTALTIKIKGVKKHEHWIRGAIENNYSEEFVNEVAAFLNVTITFFFC